MSTYIFRAFVIILLVLVVFFSLNALYSLLFSSSDSSAIVEPSATYEYATLNHEKYVEYSVPKKVRANKVYGAISIYDLEFYTKNRGGPYASVASSDYETYAKTKKMFKDNYVGFVSGDATLIGDDGVFAKITLRDTGINFEVDSAKTVWVYCDDLE